MMTTPGFLAQDSLRTCNRRCLLCNDEVDHIGLRPVVCPKDLCIMSELHTLGNVMSSLLYWLGVHLIYVSMSTGYEKLGVGLDVAAEIIRDPDVMDLMVTMLYCACKNGRVELAFPEHSFVQSGRKDTQLLSEVVDLLPSVDDMLVLAQNGVLCAELNSRHALMYPLLRWLISR